MDLSEITLAEKRISTHILNTPLLYSLPLSISSGARVWLKLENEQHTGSFKARGALNKIIVSFKNQFYTASTGNHALGFARALKITGKSGKIFLPENAKKSKVDLLRNYEVELEFYGNDCLTTELYAKERAEKDGAEWVSPYNDPSIVAGQGTLGMEIFREQPGIDAVFACVGGGGMISGVGTVIKAKSPHCKVIGCMPENSPEMCLSIREDRFVEVEPKDTLSDGSAGGFEKGSITYDICKKVVDDFVLVSEDEIKNGIHLMARSHHKMIEGAAGVTVSSFMKVADQWKDKNVVLVICGGNIDPDVFADILKKGIVP